MKETIFYFTGIHCSFDFSHEGGTWQQYTASAILTTEDDAHATVQITLIPNNHYILMRDYVSILATNNGTTRDITDDVYDPETNVINLYEAQVYSNVIIKIAAISNVAYTSIYTGQQVDESIRYTNLIKEDVPVPGTPVNTPTPADQAKVNAATLEGYNSDYFCPATRVTSASELGLIKKGVGFVLEDGVLSTDLQVVINTGTQTIDLFINTHQE